MCSAWIERRWKKYCAPHMGIKLSRKSSRLSLSCLLDSTGFSRRKFGIHKVGLWVIRIQNVPQDKNTSFFPPSQPGRNCRANGMRPSWMVKSSFPLMQRRWRKEHNDLRSVCKWTVFLPSPFSQPGPRSDLPCCGVCSGNFMLFLCCVWSGENVWLLLYSSSYFVMGHKYIRN